MSSCPGIYNHPLLVDDGHRALLDLGERSRDPFRLGHGGTTRHHRLSSAELKAMYPDTEIEAMKRVIYDALRRYPFVTLPA